MSLFTKNKNINNPTTDISQPEYHNCPVCGAKIKTIPNVIENHNEKYLDGQRKISFDILIGCYHLCGNCGYVYISTDYSQIKTVYDSIKNVVFSDKYQSIKNDSAISISLKKLMLLEEISQENTIYACEINQLWLNYYLEQNDEGKVQKYLLKRIEEIPRGLVFAKDLLPNQAPFDNKTRIQISSNAVLIDLYRRSGQFDKAKELIDYAFKHYNFSQNHDTKKYYEYQLKLVEDHDKRHI